MNFLHQGKLDVVRLLLIEHDPDDAYLVSETLLANSPLRLDIQHVDSLTEAFKTIEVQDFDVVFLDPNLPESQGLETLTRFNEKGGRFPVILLTGMYDEEIAFEAIRRGAEDYLVKGRFDQHTLLRSIRYSIDRKQNHIELRESRERFRLIAENTPGVIFLCELDEKRPPLFVNDWIEELAGYSREEFLKRGCCWRSLVVPDEQEEVNEKIQQAFTKKEPFHLQCRIYHKSSMMRWIEVYGCAFPDMKPGSPPMIEGFICDITSRVLMEKDLREMATIDSLTGVYNRRHFLELCEREIGRSRRHEIDLAAIMLDIDHFKDVNDTYGHAMGDHTLQSVARISMEILREYDIFGRIGGEEFAALLPRSNIAQAVSVAERLRLAIAEARIMTEEQKAILVTVSLGVTMLGPKDETVDQLLRRADQALYEAKSKGRDRCVMAPPPL